MSESRLKKYLPLIVVAIVSSIVTSIVVVSYVFPDRRGNLAAAVGTAVPVSQVSQVDYKSIALPSFADVAEAVGPAVVRVDTERVEQFTTGDPRMDWMFRGLFQGQQVVPGTGSGFIVSPDGHIVTNYHVIEGARKIEVTLTDGRKLRAQVIGGSKESDVAVIKINAKNLPTAQLGDSGKLRPGDWVVAIGNPYGFDHTVTAGIVSALGRSIDDGDGNTLATGDLIQTDAAINKGNSGGPLINMQGEVIGINTAIIQYAQGMGFAISMNSVRDVLNEMMTRKVTEQSTSAPKPWLGIWYQQLDENLASYLQLPDTNGILITDVYKGSPADKAKLQKGDVVREVNRKPITKDLSLADEIGKMKIGDTVLLWIWRDGQRMYVSVKLAAYPDEEPELR
ncbi:MAG TPA: trypsin-like peptidase domain-containing protein [Bacillota bacterium]|jgi:Do/DeqQ family serine protease|nr:trypsin-like peptidase domain-containing protein [Bacillota bacterium]